MLKIVLSLTFVLLKIFYFIFKSLIIILKLIIHPVIF